MTNITATAVKDLRERTGAGMMDCKKALTECNGDFEASIDWLRAKGIAAAAKKASRVASDGLIGLILGDKSGATIELNSETDFVAKNEQFQELAANICKLSLSTKGDVEKIRTSTYTGTSHDVATEIQEKIAVIGENISLRRADYLSVSEGVVVGYMHNAIAANLGTIGVLVALESKADSSKLTDIAKKIAMHIAAEKPTCLSSDQVDAALVDREKAIFTEQSLSSGKPKEIVEKMVDGRIKKFFKEVCLLEQSFVMDNKIDITTFIENSAKEIGAEIKLSAFVRFELGEGIAKEETDFAAEVAAMSKQ